MSKCAILLRLEWNLVGNEWISTIFRLEHRLYRMRMTEIRFPFLLDSNRSATLRIAQLLLLSRPSQFFFYVCEFVSSNNSLNLIFYLIFISFFIIWQILNKNKTESKLNMFSTVFSTFFLWIFFLLKIDKGLSIGLYFLACVFYWRVVSFYSQSLSFPLTCHIFSQDPIRNAALIFCKRFGCICRFLALLLLSFFIEWLKYVIYLVICCVHFFPLAPTTYPSIHFHHSPYFTLQFSISHYLLFWISCSSFFSFIFHCCLLYTSPNCNYNFFCVFWFFFLCFFF